MQLKLKRLEIKNYKNLKSVALDKLSNLNIIIGPNNCGKSHILKAIELLNFETRGVEKEERYLKDFSKDKIEIRFEFENQILSNYTITILENENNVLSFRIEGLEKISDEQKRVKLAERLLDVLNRRIVLLCPEERLTMYKDKSLEDYVIETLPDDKLDEFKKILSSIDPRIVDIVKHKSEYLKTFQLGRLYEVPIPCTIDEQGSGIKSLVCLIVDILAHKDDKDIILIDEPELGLHPSAKHWLLNWLLEVSKNHQIFIATHDPAFVNPLILGEENVAIYLYSIVDGKFKKIDFSKGKENPNLFAGFLPHTMSLKEIHIYVEGTADAYVFQAMLQKFLQSTIPEKWFEIYNKVGIYHLGGSNYSLLLYTIPLIPKSVAIFDKNIKDDLMKALDKLNKHEGCKKIFPEFRFCDNLDKLREVLKEDKVCPVYCLSVNDIKDYFGVDSKDPDVIGRVAWSIEPDKIPKEIHDIFKIILSDYLPKSRLLFSDDLTNQKSLERFKIISGDWRVGDDGLIQEVARSFCNTIILKAFKLKNGIIEVEANSLDGVGGQHVIFRCDEDRKDCYMFGSVNAGHPNLYAHFWLWKDGLAKKDIIKWEKDQLPKIEANKFHKYKVIFRDNEFEFYIDDKKIGEVKDDTISDAGYIGLHCGSKTIFRNLKVWSLDL